jgi:hypothetical protein
VSEVVENELKGNSEGRVYGGKYDEVSDVSSEIKGKGKRASNIVLCIEPLLCVLLWAIVCSSY